MKRKAAVRRTFLWLSGLPPVLYILGVIYVQRFEGWGQWAAAPVLLPALVGSVTLGTCGIYLLLRELQTHGRLDWTLLAATALASSVILYVWLINVF